MRLRRLIATLTVLGLAYAAVAAAAGGPYSARATKRCLNSKAHKYLLNLQYTPKKQLEGHWVDPQLFIHLTSSNEVVADFAPDAAQAKRVLRTYRNQERRLHQHGIVFQYSTVTENWSRRPNPRDASLVKGCLRR